MVYGGQISFCLYMVHELVHTAWGWAVEQFELTPWHSDSAWKWNVFGLLAIAVVISVLMYHFVEEPARRWMRRMVDFSGPNADAQTDSAALPATGKLQSVDRALEARAG
jgi:peptidoglycan/LPS O-acetylase OafA/YrhL